MLMTIMLIVAGDTAVRPAPCAVSVLPTPDGPHSMNTPIGLLGLSSLARLVWMRLAMASIAWSWPMTRSFRLVGDGAGRCSISSLTIRPTGMPVQSPTTAATASAIDRRRTPSGVALGRVQVLPSASCEAASSVAVGLGRLRASSPARRAASARGDRAAITPASGCLFASHLAVTSAQRGRVLRRCASIQLGRVGRSHAADRPRASPCSRSTSSSSTLALASSTGGRRRVLRDGDAGAGGVEQADRLVGQLARRDIALRQLDRGVDRLVEHDRPGDACPCHRPTDRGSWRRRLSVSGSSTLTVWKRRVSAGSFSKYWRYSAQVVARDGAQLAARQRGLEQVGGIAGARLRRRRRSGCGLRR